MKPFYSMLIISLMISSPALPQGFQNDTQPNIIFIMADDMGYGDLGSYGQELIQTPHLDQLAKEGTRFTQAYASPVCTPSRSILMTCQQQRFDFTHQQPN